MNKLKVNSRPELMSREGQRLQVKSHMSKFIMFIWCIPRNLAVFLVGIYQKTLSPDHSVFMKVLFPYGHCKFKPSCSAYSKLAFERYGFVLGLLKTVWRVLRCNPWAKGGNDLP